MLVPLRRISAEASQPSPELAETLTVELEPCREVFTIPIDPPTFVAEAYGPVLLNAELQLNRFRFH